MEDINQNYPIMEESTIADLIDLGEMYVYVTQPQYVDRDHSFIPVVPIELINAGRFRVSLWGYLVLENIKTRAARYL